MKDLAEQIPEAAIEAGARVLAGLDEGEQWPSNTELGGGPTGTRDDEFRDGLREEVADLLAAALPHLHPVVTTTEELPRVRRSVHHSGILDLYTPDMHKSIQSQDSPETIHGLANQCDALAREMRMIAAERGGDAL